MKTLWVHVPSVGEYNTVKPLLEKLKENHRIVLTYFSPRAENFLEKQQLPNEVYKLPFPLGKRIQKFADTIKPDIFILTESDRFPALLSVKVPRKFIVNARISEKSFKFLKLLKFLYEKYLNSFDLIVCKDGESYKRFISLGVEQSRLKVCGNLKAVFKTDVEIDLEKPKRFIFTAGSTHRGEEEEIFRAFKIIKEKIPNAFLIVAPRHIERAKEVYGKAVSFFPNLKVGLGSEGNFNVDILIVDTLGELLKFYAISDVTFVGGSLIPIGGHNLLEPAYFSKPVLYGPYIQKFLDLEEILRRLGLGFKVSGAEDIAKTVLEIYKKGVNPKGNLKEISQKVLNCYLELISGR